jgi:hypothetical protein
MSDQLALSLGQQFELERMNRVIDSTGDAQILRGLAKQLLQAWQSQKAATQWIMRQQLAAPSSFALDAAKGFEFMGGDSTNPSAPAPGSLDVL